MGVTLPPRRHLKMTEDISDYHNWVKGDTASIEGLEARDAAKHLPNAKDRPNVNVRTLSTGLQ